MRFGRIVTLGSRAAVLGVATESGTVSSEGRLARTPKARPSFLGRLANATRCPQVGRDAVARALRDFAASSARRIGKDAVTVVVIAITQLAAVGHHALSGRRRGVVPCKAGGQMVGLHLPVATARADGGGSSAKGGSPGRGHRCSVGPSCASCFVVTLIVRYGVCRRRWAIAPTRGRYDVVLRVVDSTGQVSAGARALAVF